MAEIKHKDVIIKIIGIYHPNAKVYLFGSYAHGTNKPGSDIDIAIDAGRKLTLSELRDPAILIDALPMSPKVDLVDLNRVPPAMKKEIVEGGKVWKR
jgi:predicted nucleotidyltransferase